MASEQELLDSAAQHARNTTWTWDKYLARIQADPGYAYAKTEWYRAGADLEAVKTVPPEPEPEPAPTPPPVADYLAWARARIFLADHPEACLQAPGWMTPVCTADAAYRSLYTSSLLKRLRDRFGRVEAWCDCGEPPTGTPYHEAQRMVDELYLDGPAWGQCETTAQFDHAYAAGARRMVGSINASVLDSNRLKLVSSGAVLLSVELYRNVQPNMQPDWRNANAGVGGNCIACYASAREGAVYTPVSAYRDAGLYVSGHDSVYGVGLQPADWAALA